MFATIVVGTDGSATAREAVRQATQLAKIVDATLHLVSAYEPVSGSRLRHERRQVPEDAQWVVNAREDVDAVLEEAAAGIEEQGPDGRALRARGRPRRRDPRRGRGAAAPI